LGNKPKKMYWRGGGAKRLEYYKEENKNKRVKVNDESKCGPVGGEGGELKNSGDVIGDGNIQVFCWLIE
jgi:hypothetical protein